MSLVFGVFCEGEDAALLLGRKSAGINIVDLSEESYLLCCELVVLAGKRAIESVPGFFSPFSSFLNSICSRFSGLFCICSKVFDVFP